MGQHSILPPSSAHIWRYCSGWVQLAQDNPQGETEDTLRGNAIHEIRHLLIDAGMHGGLGPVLRVGDVATNGTVINDEMFECGELAAQIFLKEWQARICGGGAKYGIEHQVQCPGIHPDNYGTPDGWLWAPNDNTLIIDDCKGGHVHVDAHENWQEIDYSSGIVDYLGLTDPNIAVWMRLVQPFSYHSDGPVRTWKTTLGALQRKYWPELSVAAHEAMGPNAQCRTGHQCRRCHVRHVCTAALQCGMELYETTMFPVQSKLPPPALGLQMKIVDRAMEQLKALKTGYEEQVKATIKGGARVPGWCLQPTASREKWQKSQQEVVLMGQLFDVDLKKDDLITPNHARKAGIPDDILAVYSGRTTGLELKPESTDKVRMIFNKEHNNVD